MSSPRPPSSEPSVWALSAYPVSAAYRTRIEAALGTTVDVTVLSDMRSAGVFCVLRDLLSRRHAQGLVLIEEESSQPVVPVLRFLVSSTRCRSLALAQPDATTQAFSRRSGLFDAIRLAAGSMSGVLAALRCALHLLWLRRLRPQRPRLRPVRHVAYLKTNLWFGLKAGGSVGHVAGVVNALARRCDRIDVLAVERPPLLAPEVAYHPVRNVGAFGYPYELNYYRYESQFARSARRVFARSRPDVVYHRVSLSNYSGLRLARRLAVPLIVEYNGSEVWVSRHWGRPLLLPRLAEAAEEVALRHADLIVTVSRVLLDELVAKGISPARILVHPNCVDPRQFDPDAFGPEDRRRRLADYGIAPQSVVCGFIGTFGAWHGVDLLAETIKILVDEHHEWLRRYNVHFLLVGDGRLMPKVREILAGPAIQPFVTLTGLIPQQQAPSYLAAADILLSPHVPNADGTRFFGSPTKLFEYMAMQKPIVASDLEQIGEVLRRSYRAGSLPEGPCTEADQNLSLLIEPGSRAQLASAIKFLVEQPDYRRILGRNARAEVLRHYTWDRNVEELLKQLAAVSTLEH